MSKKIIGIPIGTPLNPNAVIEKTKTDEAISKLSEDIATKASAIKEKASGEVIVVTDSDEAKPLGLAIDGKSEQNQYSGNQLFDASKIPTKSQGGATVTNNGDGSFTVSGSGLLSKSYDNTYTLSHESFVSLFKAGKVYLKTDFISGPYLYIHIRNESGIVKSYSLEQRLIIEGEILQSYLDDESIYMIIGFYGFTNMSIVNNTIRLMIYQDGDGTWEPFVGRKPSPSTEYKQDITNTGKYDEASGKYAVEVKFNKKNLLDLRGFTTGNSKGITITNNGDSTLSITGTSTSDVGVNLMGNGYVGNNVCYSLNKGSYVVSGVPSHLSLVGYKANVDTPRSVYLRNGINTFDEDIEFVSVSLRCSSNETFNENRVELMIRPIEIADDTWEQFGETTATVLLNEPLRKGDKAYWNGGSKIRVDRYKAVEKLTGLKFYARADRVGNYNAYSKTVLSACKRIANTEKADAFCNVARVLDLETIVGNKNDNTFAICYSSSDATNTLIEFCMKQFETVEEFQSWFDSADIYVEYPLAEPSTEEIDIDLDGLSMFYPTTILSNDCNANMEVTYVADTKAYIDKKFAELATAMV